MIHLLDTVVSNTNHQMNQIRMANLYHSPRTHCSHSETSSCILQIERKERKERERHREEKKKKKKESGTRKKKKKNFSFSFLPPPHTNKQTNKQTTKQTNARKDQRHVPLVCAITLHFICYTIGWTWLQHTLIQKFFKLNIQRPSCLK